MREMHFGPGTTPKGKGMTRNQILAHKLLWVDEMDLAPVVQVDSDRDLNQMSPKITSSSKPKQRSNKSNK